MLSIHITPKKFKNATTTGGFRFVFEERFRKARFRDGLVWKVGLTVEIKLHFQISLAYCGQASDTALFSDRLSLGSSRPFSPLICTRRHKFWLFVTQHKNKASFKWSRSYLQ